MKDKSKLILELTKAYNDSRCSDYKEPLKTVLDMLESSNKENATASNVGMSMSHLAIAKVIGDYIANHKGDNDKQYTAYEIKTLLISDDSDNKGEWIPVSERLPEESGRYLTYIVNEYDEKLQYIMTADYIARPILIEGLSPWYPDDECASDNVVAWIPLPDPYKGE